MEPSRAGAYQGTFQNLPKEERPCLERSEIADFDRVAQFVGWFLLNEPFVSSLSDPGHETIFREVYRPRFKARRLPWWASPPAQSLPEWFATKVFIDLNMLKDASRETFWQFLDLLGGAVREALAAAGDVAGKYGLDLDNFNYERDVGKLPTRGEREWFKVNLLCESVLGAEMRIMACLYCEYFGEAYQPRESRV